MSDSIKIRRSWSINPVERLHGKRRKPKREDIPPEKDIQEQLEEMAEEKEEDNVISRYFNSW